MKKRLLSWVLLLGIAPAAFSAIIATSGYLDPNAADPSLPTWARRAGFDLGAAQGFPSEHTNVVLVDFLLQAPGAITIESFGFAANGIDPYITLYSGNSASPGTAAFELEHSPGGDFSLLSPALGAGNYVLAISAWNNYGCPFGFGGCTLADGFSGLANLPFGHDTFFDIRVTGEVTPAPIPEPSQIMMIGPGLIVLFARRQFFKTE